MRIDLHTQAFNTLVADANGTHWMVTGMEGWDSPGQRQSTAPPTSRHGAVILESMLDTRAITLRGVVKATGEGNFWAAYNALLGLVNNLTVPRVMKVHETPVKRISVIRGGAPRLAHVGVGSFTFEIPLLALDPLKYADVAKSAAISGTLTLTNDGTFDSEPIFTLTGAGTFSVTNTTRSAYAKVSSGSKSLPSGTVIDFNKRSVMLNGVSYFSSLEPNAVFWSLAPGANSIKSEGSAPLSYTFRDAYI